MSPSELATTAAAYAPWIVTACAAAAAALPKPKNRGLMMFLRQVLDAAAFNFGNAENKP